MSAITVKDLSPDQRAAYDAIMRWVADPGSRDLLTLGGYAGVGKSLLVSLVAEQLDLPAFCAFSTHFDSGRKSLFDIEQAKKRGAA